MRKDDAENYEREQAIIRRLKEQEEREAMEKMYQRFPWLRVTKLPKPKNTFF